MSFSRKTVATESLSGEALSRAMVGIGMLFATEADPEANIEDTLLAASIEGVEHDDLRVLSILTTWFDTHQAHINVGRLTRLVSAQSSIRVLAYWAAMATYAQKDRRFARMARLYQGARVELLRVGTVFQIARRGEDKRFVGTCLRVPAAVLRERAADVLTPRELAKCHSSYKQRIFMGPSYRADMWAALQSNSKQSAAELARQTYGSFATAWQVKKDFQLLET